MKVFEESQKFTQPWLIFLLGGILMVVLTESFKQSAGNFTLQMLMPVIIILLVIVLFIWMRLDTRIDESGIYYRFFPFHGSKRHIKWEELSDCYVRKYSPITEYGGWGIRGFNRNGSRGMALNVRGNYGIQLIFKDGGKLLLGTQNPDAARKTIANYQYKIEGYNTESRKDG